MAVFTRKKPTKIDPQVWVINETWLLRRATNELPELPAITIHNQVPTITQLPTPRAWKQNEGQA